MSPADVVAVFAHPDDESLLAGGLLAACVDAGLRVGVASLTRGELGPIAAPGITRAQLGAERERELAAAAQELGCGWARCLGFPDGELQDVDRQQALQALHVLLEPGPPRAVVTFGPEGLYWHPDHLAVHELVHEAAGELVPVYEVTWPHGLAEQVTAELRTRGFPHELWGIEPGAFGAPPETIVAELDVTPWLERKLSALHCYRTQLGDQHLLRRLPADLARRLLGHEWLCAPADHIWLTELVAGG